MNIFRLHRARLNRALTFSLALIAVIISATLVFGHGAADITDGRRLARQLLTPEDPSIGAPHLGVSPDGYPVANALFGGL